MDVLPMLADNSIDLILTDPPYFKVKNEVWDRQWENPKSFLGWLDCVLEEFARVLKPNGSLYLFASPKMAARVECLVSERLNVLNRIRWVKEAGWHNKAEKEGLRSYLSPWEEIIFAEHYGADNIAKGEAGYAARCEELRGFVFEPLRAYLDSERRHAGFNFEMVRQAVGCAVGSGLPSHWFTSSQWMLPTSQNYQKLRTSFNAGGGDYLRREYEDLRREYEDLRRPFSVSADVPYTDVWDFPTVSHYPGKHPCEKPQALLQHIIQASSRPGALVLDCFAGTGSTGLACLATGRKFTGVECEPRYYCHALQRIEETQQRINSASARISEARR
jgi:site-specific DNA-methyltransferase (adenine-specific)